MYEKIKKIFKYVILPITFIAGFFVGRKRTTGTNRDYEQLLADNERLIGEVDNLREQVKQLSALNRLGRKELEELDCNLSTARKAAELARVELDDSQDGLGRLEETNTRLAEFLQRYRTELENMESNIDSSN